MLNNNHILTWHALWKVAEIQKHRITYLPMLPWIFPGAPLIFNGAPGSIQGYLTGIGWVLMICFQETCYEEQLRVFGEETPILDYDGLKECHMLDRCVKETLRLRPPIMTMMRMCKSQQVWGRPRDLFKPRQNGGHSQMTFSNLFPWIEIVIFWFRFHRNLFPKI